jgi:hypothetical protein
MTNCGSEPARGDSIRNAAQRHLTDDCDFRPEMLGVGATEASVSLCFLMIAAKAKKTSRGRDGCDRSPIRWLYPPSGVSLFGEFLPEPPDLNAHYRVVARMVRGRLA